MSVPMKLRSLMEGPSTSGSSISIRGRVNKHLNYRDLQRIARQHNIPCNLKKETMRIAIEARMNGNEELINVILKSVKEERLLRKKVASKFSELHSLSMQSRSACLLDNQDSKLELNKRMSNFSIRDFLLQKMVNETSAKNVTICKTEVVAEYHSNYEPNNSSGSSSSYHPPSSENNTANPQRPLPPVLSGTRESMMTSFMSPSIYSTTKMVKSDTTMVSSFNMPKQYGDIPQQMPRYCQPGQFSYFDNQPREQNANYNTMLEGYLPHVEDSPEPDFLPPQTNVANIPPLETLMINRTMAVDNNSCVVAQEAIHPSPLNYLAEMAVIFEKDSEYYSKISNETPNINNCSVNRNELIVADTRPTSQSIPTWNNFLEQRTGKCVIRGSRCKFGCQTINMSSVAQLEHESSCKQQPFTCPVGGCQQVMQLGSLSTHVLNYHHSYINKEHEASFRLTYGNDQMFNSVYHPNPEDGPKRDTFFQFVNHRLFVIFVVGNFQNMQMMVYVQYVDDYNDYVSTGVIEILRPDGIPFQWVGKFYPVSVSSTRIVSNGRCLIFNMNTIPRMETFTIHVKIRNHRLMPVST